MSIVETPYFKGVKNICKFFLKICEELKNWWVAFQQQNPVPLGFMFEYGITTRSQF
jgi:hypothetical protein